MTPTNGCTYVLRWSAHRCAPRCANSRGTGRNPKEVRDMAHDSQALFMLHAKAVQ